MKIRSGFVSNSSSSSFVVTKNMITEEQIEAIKYHVNYAKEHLKWNDIDTDYDFWNVSETETKLTGYTIMDNFDMYKFFKDINLPNDSYEFDDY
jgi:hypothetical protein